MMIRANGGRWGWLLDEANTRRSFADLITVTGRDRYRKSKTARFGRSIAANFTPASLAPNRTIAF